MGATAAIVGSSLVSGVMGSRAAGKAASAQQAAAAASIAEQRRQFDIIQEQAAPYRGVGKEALYSLADMMGLNITNPYDEQIAALREKMGPAKGGISQFAGPQARAAGLGTVMSRPLGGSGAGQAGTSAQQEELNKLLAKQQAFEQRKKYDFTQAPGYEFRLGEGYKGLERSQAGRRLSGRALKEAQRYGQEFASQEFGSQFGRLSQLAGFGPATVGAGMPTGIPGTLERAGAAQAQGAYDKYGSYNQAIQGGLSNYMAWQAYNQNYPRGGGSGVAGDAYMPAYQR